MVLSNQNILNSGSNSTRAVFVSLSCLWRYSIARSCVCMSISIARMMAAQADRSNWSLGGPSTWCSPRPNHSVMMLAMLMNVSSTDCCILPFFFLVYFDYCLEVKALLSPDCGHGSSERSGSPSSSSSDSSNGICKVGGRCPPDAVA